ncbi:PilN domain-containing protein [Bradyrhizobium sp. INPA03-11B]|uniref:PilN domain-containing protein n=1 Tax=Bradyrhizobium sp. INPA03-11B TaxID=418598 RepID=UPI00338E925A
MQALGTRLSQFPSRFGVWWCNEVQTLLPKKFLEWLKGSKRRAVVVSLTGMFIDMEVVGEERKTLATNRTTVDAFSKSILDRFLRAQGLDLNTEIGIRVTSEQIFRRTILLPIQAKQKIDETALRDLFAKTPFRSKDIHCGQSSCHANDAKTITVYQWIVLRQIVQDIATALTIRVEDLSYVEGPPEPGGLVPHISLRSDQDRKISWFSRIVRGSIVSSLMLAVVAGSAECWRQQSTLDALESKIAAARGHAQRVRTAMQKFERRESILRHIRERKTGAPGFLDVWEDTSRLLPPHSWLTELRLSQSDNIQQVSMIGFSSAAAALVGIINASPRFTETQLTAPVTVDPSQGRERFSLQAKLRSPELTELAKP